MVQRTSLCWPWFSQIFVDGESTSVGSTIMCIVESNTLQHCIVNIYVETIHSRTIGIVSPNRLAEATLLIQENAYVETRGGDSKRSHTDMDFLSRIVYHNCESD